MLENYLNTSRKIIFLTTGGTIEKTYDEGDGSLANRTSLIEPRILSKLRLPYTSWEVSSIMFKDSLDMTDVDREVIAKNIQDTQEKGHPIIVIHGTDTMAETAAFCHEKFSPKVPVIFTGAMRPVGLEDTDAHQNVTEALVTSKLLKKGFYVAFHGEVFSVPNVRKNKKKGTFEQVT